MTVRKMLAIACLVSCFAAAVCVGLLGSSSAPDEKYGGTLVWGVSDDPLGGLCPILTNGGTDLFAYGFSAQPLSWGGENYPAELRPILATSWEVSPDGLVWTIHLRSGVNWQDGKPFTADDVLFWAQTIQDPATGAEWFRERFYVDGLPFTFEKIDAYTVRVTTAAPVDNLMSSICVPLIPAHYFIENNISNSEIATSPANVSGGLGTGPFRIAEYRPSEAIILERFDGYWRGRPYLDRVVLRIIPDPDAMLSALLSGEVDWTMIAVNQIPQVKKSAACDVIAIPVDAAYSIALNSTKPMLADKRTRHALMEALDRRAIWENVSMGYGQILYGPWIPVCTAYEDLPDYPYDVAAAKALLAEVGWLPGPGGILVAGNVAGVVPGTRFRLEYWVTRVGDAFPTLVQAYWRDIGVEVEQKFTESSVFFDENMGKADKPFDVYTVRNGFFGPSAGNYSDLIGSDAAASMYSYANSQVAALFDQASHAASPAEADVYYKQAGRIIWDDLPILPLFQRTALWAYNTRVQYADAVVSASLLGVFENPELLWVKK